ncbi:MAG: hypothetical protein IJL91_14740 [Bacteroidales bacterium]|nr:hypothetical protein [Bacteroidales bacterium]
MSDRTIKGVMLPSGGTIVAGSEDASKIIYHEPRGEGDRHYVDVYEDGSVRRIFDIKELYWEEDES